MRNILDQIVDDLFILYHLWKLEKYHVHFKKER